MISFLADGVQMNPAMAVGGGVCALICLACYFWGYRRSSLRYDLIREVPTVAAKDIPGLGADMVEVKGIARVDQPLVSDLARLACVAFESRVTESWTTTRTVRDSDGKTRTETEHHSETRYQNEKRIAFGVQDASGSVVVHPEGASYGLARRDGFGRHRRAEIRQPPRSESRPPIPADRFRTAKAFSRSGSRPMCWDK